MKERENIRERIWKREGGEEGEEQDYEKQDNEMHQEFMIARMKTSK